MSPRQIAKAAGVSHQTVYGLVAEGDAPETQAITLHKLWTWLDSPDRQKNAQRGTSNPSDVSSDDTVPVSRYTLGLIRGRLETTVAWVGSIENQMGALGGSVHALGASVHAAGDTLKALRDMLDKATNGMAGLLDGTIIPDPNGNGGTAAWHLPTHLKPTMDQIEEARRELDELEKEIAAQGTGGDSKKQAGGGGAAT